MWHIDYHTEHNFINSPSFFFQLVKLDVNINIFNCDFSQAKWTIFTFLVHSSTRITLHLYFIVVKIIDQIRDKDCCDDLYFFSCFFFFFAFKSSWKCHSTNCEFTPLN